MLRFVGRRNKQMSCTEGSVSYREVVVLRMRLYLALEGVRQIVDFKVAIFVDDDSRHRAEDKVLQSNISMIFFAIVFIAAFWASIAVLAIKPVEARQLVPDRTAGSVSVSLWSWMPSIVNQTSYSCAHSRFRKKCFPTSAPANVLSHRSRPMPFPPWLALYIVSEVLKES